MEHRVAALAYEDIVLGQTASLDVRIAPELVDAFARLTGDINPLHVSDEFARSKGFDGRLAHGLLTASFFSAIVGTMLPGRDCLLQTAKFAFKKPILAGELLTLKAVVVQKVDAYRTLTLEITASDSRGEVAVGGSLQAGVL